MVKALILIADGTEEMEFTITYDTLVRAGVQCTSAFVPDSATPPPVPSSAALLDTTPESKTTPTLVECSRGVKILPDTTLDPLKAGPDIYDLLVIPGGLKGAQTIAGSSPVQHLIRAYHEYPERRLIGMICAGSLAALQASLKRQPLTSHPSVKAQLEDKFEYKEDSVVVSDRLVTSRGPGTAFPFALTLVELLFGAEKRDEVRGPMVFPVGTPW
ncbi:class I glutamine amidotransferase-like protein [Hygrophoropsis aurantiaca]|uniref:Class I glutamine amidotransferase-like protein n=1 Tax=Hygrophoropsis aurantiaca TaxID=72124 RepID=A0ACB8A4G7_9AGAM|nr:class I glutamine amidotransferase-like protein [Hygrophoropsis aurantiaca]